MVSDYFEKFFFSSEFLIDARGRFAERCKMQPIILIKIIKHVLYGGGLSKDKNRLDEIILFFGSPEINGPLLTCFEITHYLVCR